jgi:hypothetical protein
MLSAVRNWYLKRNEVKAVLLHATKGLMGEKV